MRSDVTSARKPTSLLQTRGHVSHVRPPLSPTPKLPDSFVAAFHPLPLPLPAPSGDGWRSCRRGIPSTRPPASLPATVDSSGAPGGNRVGRARSVAASWGWGAWRRGGWWWAARWWGRGSGLGGWDPTDTPNSLPCLWRPRPGLERNTTTRWSHGTSKTTRLTERCSRVSVSTGYDKNNIIGDTPAWTQRKLEQVKD